MRVGGTLADASDKITEMFLPETEKQRLAELRDIRSQVAAQDAFFARAGMGGVRALPPVSRKAKG